MDLLEREVIFSYHLLKAELILTYPLYAIGNPNTKAI